MLKKIFSILIMILLLVRLSGNVFAKDIYTATSTINGVTVNWEYKVNESNQIENLKCTNPTALTGNITIPSTLDGRTVISLANEALKSATKITEIEIPSTVKEIGLWAFSGCTSLSKVDLGNVQKISDQSFKDCTGLTSIKLPKTLNKNASGAPFVGCTNLKNIVLEEGMTVIPDYVCANTPITEIEIPSTVKEIGLWAFSGCTSLSKVDLGNVQKISDQSFKNCTALTSIKLPKTLNKDASGEPFVGCTNLKNIVLEEGMTVIPDYVCASTPITEIVIPNTAKEIGMWAFKNCSLLKKITILDNVENIEGYNSSNSDLVFQNHNEDLTIYCYKDSMAAKYAIKYNIKYVYLEKTTTDNNTDKKEEQNQQKKPNNTPTNNQKPIKKEDTTIATGKLPQTGATITGLFIILIISIVSTIFYVKYRKFRDIK